MLVSATHRILYPSEWHPSRDDTVEMPSAPGLLLRGKLLFGESNGDNRQNYKRAKGRGGAKSKFKKLESR